MAISGLGRYPFKSAWALGGSRLLYQRIAFGDYDDVAKVVWTDWFFTSPATTSYTITAQGGSYLITGATSTISKSKVLVASGGSYSSVGANATILRSRLITAQGGSYSFTGASVNITYTSAATVYTLTCLGGSYSLTGQVVTISKSKNLVAQGGTYAFTGQSAQILKSKILIAQGGSYTLIGASAGITYTPVGGISWPSPSQVLAGVYYGPNGNDYVGTLDIGKKFRLDIATGNIVMVIDGKKVMSL